MLVAHEPPQLREAAADLVRQHALPRQVAAQVLTRRVRQ
jgi:hypothetical protein